VTSGSPASTPSSVPAESKPLLLDRRVESFVKEGWQVVNRTPTTAQLKKPKQWSQGCLIFSVFLALLGGFVYSGLWVVAIVAFLVAVVDYAIKEDELVYLTEEQLQQEEQRRIEEQRRREEQAKRDEQERLKRQREREEQKRLKEERKRTQQAAQSQVKARERLEKSPSPTLRRKRVILGVLSLVVCAGLAGGALLVWQARNLLFPRPIEVTVLIPVTESFTPQPSPTLRPSSTPRPVVTERDVRNKLCQSLRSGQRVDRQAYRINQRNGIVTVWIDYIYLGQQSCGDSRLRIKVAVVNDSNISIHVNPLHFTVIDFKRRTYNLDSHTFGLDNYFDATDLLPDTYTDGWLEFDIASETPRYIVYDDGFSPIIQFDLTEELSPFDIPHANTNVVKTPTKLPPVSSPVLARPTPFPTPTISPLINVVPPIAFVSDRDGYRNIYVMSTDASNPVQLTNVSANDHYPDWSPDGLHIAFPSDRDGDWEIYVMNADGSNLEKLSDNSAYDGNPAWSADGTKIIFDTNRDNANEDQIYVMNADGSDPIQVTNISAHNLAPVWSPDGTRIVFCSDRDGLYDIYTMNADGSNPIRLTNHPADDLYPVWSPDGMRIAFFSDRDGNNEIYVIDADGSNLTRLTNNPATDWDPAWSPNGAMIVFVSDRDGDPEIYVMNNDGSNLIQLTNNSANDWVPAWSPR